jgi:hypothetical protein
MKLSDEELKRIQQSHKSKDLAEIIAEEKKKSELLAEEKKKKDEEDDDDTSSDDDTDGDDEDGHDENFISDMVKGHKISDTQAKRESIYAKLKAELSNTIKKLRSAIRPVTSELRSLDNEVGGLEVDYKKIAKINDKDVDVWDKQPESITKEAVIEDNKDKEDNKLFIHMAKTETGMFYNKHKHGKRHMGPVNLKAASSDDDDVKPESYVERLSHLKEDRGHEKGGGIEF